MTGYTKLFSSIVHSTIWRAEDHVRLVWITMLALADKNGEVEASIPGLADASRVTLDQCLDALAKLSESDPYSRSQDFEGRRIEEIQGGWCLLNYAKYRAKMSLEDRREKTRLRVAKHREKKKLEESNAGSNADVTKCHAGNYMQKHKQKNIKNKKEDSSEQLHSPSAKLIKSLDWLTDYTLTAEQVKLIDDPEFCPALCKPATIRNANAWIIANPTKRKKQVGTFLIKWMQREQEKGHNPYLPKTYNPRSVPSLRVDKSEVPYKAPPVITEDKYKDITRADLPEKVKEMSAKYAAKQDEGSNKHD